MIIIVIVIVQKDVMKEDRRKKCRCKEFGKRMAMDRGLTWDFASSFVWIVWGIQSVWKKHPSSEHACPANPIKQVHLPQKLHIPTQSPTFSLLATSRSLLMYYVVAQLNHIFIYQIQDGLL